MIREQRVVHFEALHFCQYRERGKPCGAPAPFIAWVTSGDEQSHLTTLFVCEKHLHLLEWEVEQRAREVYGYDGAATVNVVPVECTGTSPV